MSSFLLTVLREKCPFCEKGDVFVKGKFYKIPRMHAACPVCKRDYVGEPGYYFGAMYVSYGIAVAVGITAFFICWFLLDIKNPKSLLAIILLSILAIARRNYKWSRIIWLKIFPPGKNTRF